MSSATTSRLVDDTLTTRALQRAVVGAVLIVLAVILGIALALEGGQTHIDSWWNATVAVLFPPSLPLSFALNGIGGGWFATYVIPLGGVVVFALFRRWREGLFFLVALAGSAVLVQLWKAVFGRLRPEDILVISDHGSFPSGHTANAATLAMVAVILFPRVWVAVVGAAWVLLMAFSRTQVHAHWLSDTVGGALIGAGAALVVAALFTPFLARDRR